MAGRSLEAEHKLAASSLLREWRAPVTLGPSEYPPPVPLPPSSSRGRRLIFLYLLELPCGSCGMFCTEELGGSSPLKSPSSR